MAPVSTPTNSLDSLYRALKARRRRAQKRGEPTGDLDAAAMALVQQMAAPGRPRVLVKCPPEVFKTVPVANLVRVEGGGSHIQWDEWTQFFNVRRKDGGYSYVRLEDAVHDVLADLRAP